MTSTTTSPPAMTPRRAATAALLGSALEYYDFFVYGAAAALVFNVLFFPSGDPTVALIASFATFAVGYVARPVGAMVMGHFGDRLAEASDNPALGLVLALAERVWPGPAEAGAPV